MKIAGAFFFSDSELKTTWDLSANLMCIALCSTLMCIVYRIEAKVPCLNFFSIMVTFRDNCADMVDSQELKFGVIKKNDTCSSISILKKVFKV